jgi:hypothetical protein
MSAYQKEQLDAAAMVRRYLEALPPSEKQQLKELTADYIRFRKSVRVFLENHFGDVCHEKCYRSRLSACCSRDGIITFLADVAINAMFSTVAEMERLLTVLQKPNNGLKCIYLGPEGCLWKVKPIVCEMFLCDPAQESVFKNNPEAGKKWKDFREAEKSYRWPDRPVLFDTIERIFMDAGHISSLMYLHNSPGLLRVKRRAGLNT